MFHHAKSSLGLRFRMLLRAPILELGLHPLSFLGLQAARPAFSSVLCGKRKKHCTQRTPPLLGYLHFSIVAILWRCPVCPADMSHLSHRHSGQSERTYAVIRSGRPGCPRDFPEIVLGTLAAIPTTEVLHVFIFIGDFSSLLRSHKPLLAYACML